MRKRAQITIFIIIGIVILLSAATIFYIARQPAAELSETAEPVLAEVPQELLPVQQYVESCIRLTAADALRRLGQHGGYVALDDYMLGRSMLANDIDPTSGDAVSFLPGSDASVYWHYMKSDNGNTGTCEFSSLGPPLKGSQPYSAESQLARYMDQNLGLCTSGFFPLAEKGFTVAEGLPSTSAVVADGDVRFLVTYPLSISQDGSEASLEKFYVKIPLQLKKAFTMARDIASSQQQYNFIEANTIELIDLFSGVGNNELGNRQLPPMSESDFKFGAGEIWVVKEVEESLKLMLSSWMPLLQVSSSANYRQIAVPSGVQNRETVQALYDRFTLPIEGYDDIKARFGYNSWPIYFNPNSRGGVIKAESLGSSLLPFVGLQKYETFYDMSFPVSVELTTAPTAEFPDGYKLVFFLEANIRNNEPHACENALIESTIGVQDTLICNENQRDAELDIKVKNSVTGASVDDAQVTYSLGGVNCQLGQASGKINAPSGLGIQLGFFRQDYLAASETADIESGEKKEISVQLHPVKEMKADAKKLVSGSLQPLSANESVVIILRRVKEKPTDPEFTAIAEYRNTPVGISLAPGTYEADIQLMVNEETVIPKKKECAKKIGPVCIGTIRVPEITMPAPYPWGGYKGEITVTTANLMKDNVIFKAIRFPPPAEAEDLEKLGSIEEVSRQNSILLRPDFR